MEENYPNSYFITEKVTPEQMDVLWADGWRHFGTLFFRDTLNWFENKYVSVIPLRINLEKFTLSKSQRKILRQNEKTRVEFKKASIDEEKQALFYKHIVRFERNVPDSIYNFVSQNPSEVPCQMQECCVYDEHNRLYAVSFLDIGAQSTSSVYAMFDPAYSHRSPGLHTLLCEIAFAIEQNKKYLYTGYAYPISSHYDYKKKFKGTEQYDWKGNWRDLLL